MHSILSLLAQAIPSAFAQNPCGGIVGCTAAGNQLLPFITVIGTVMVDAAAALSMVFVIIGGAFLLLNFGNETNATKGRTAITFALAGFALTLASQAIISFVVSRAGTINMATPHLGIMQGLVSSMLNVFNVVFALVMIFFGFKLVIGRGAQTELDSAKKGIGWAIGGALVINLSYALVRAVMALGF